MFNINRKKFAANFLLKYYVIYFMRDVERTSGCALLFEVGFEI